MNFSFFLHLNVLTSILTTFAVKFAVPSVLERHCSSLAFTQRPKTCMFVALVTVRLFVSGNIKS